MVLDADAVIDPGTVVVIALNTKFADGAVTAATRSNGLAVRAQLCAINHVK